jgi:hypothetical protein
MSSDAFTIRQALQGAIGIEGLSTELIGQIRSIQRRIARQYNRAVKRETKAQQYRTAALAGGGQREMARRLRQIWRCSLTASNGLVLS